MAEEDPPRATLLVRSDSYVDAERSPRFLRLRSLALKVQGEGQPASDEGTWEFVERPLGLDAAVVVIFRRTRDGLEVLLRRGLRVPLAVGRPHHPRGPGARAAVFVEEVVAGLIEEGEIDEAAITERARREVAEETGYILPTSALTRLGAPLWATPGLCAEVLHFFSADATLAVAPDAPVGDGSPFELLSSVAWYPIDAAIARVSGLAPERPGNSLGDLRAELGLRRLKEIVAR